MIHILIIQGFNYWIKQPKIKFDYFLIRSIIKKYPYFGVGNKNYRVETCNTFYEVNINLLRNDYVCETHPHQIYFEFISEHGAVGTIILLGILFFIFFLGKD